MEATKKPESDFKDLNNTENQTQETKNSENQTEDNISNGSPIKRTITGTLIGATIGYLATPENGKKLKESMSAEQLKSTGSSIGQTVKEKSKKAVDTIKGSAGKLFKKDDVSTDGYSNETDENPENETTLNSNNEKDIKKHNKESSGNSDENVNERIDRLEEMLSRLLEEDGGQETSNK
ncbi:MULTISPECIES: YtxH domain-containing protein [unclassified Cytobacillus]|uniref:YtxH domain-containing protein n=1 Tax=unclassified Cytobacillus TaxID=2675268 RepID=UPI0020406D7B|nr:YtxH domain-containing protein [Cytobacillus sp. AMY 15.2]MCM3094377.1 YtxH domain-containing protein [Cytobacillus sp. AMY 15.2]